ncbi:hypothetical protein N0V90_003453 [Kalmusia sp. IMI 367209]|nr:hypothetical protein N0V90_003453 [Kalmusia sp. IMI 367209]
MEPIVRASLDELQTYATKYFKDEFKCLPSIDAVIFETWKKPKPCQYRKDMAPVRILIGNIGTNGVYAYIKPDDSGSGTIYYNTGRQRIPRMYNSYLECSFFEPFKFVNPHSQWDLQDLGLDIILQYFFTLNGVITRCHRHFLLSGFEHACKAIANRSKPANYPNVHSLDRIAAQRFQACMGLRNDLGQAEITSTTRMQSEKSHGDLHPDIVPGQKQHGMKRQMMSGLEDTHAAGQRKTTHMQLMRKMAQEREAQMKTLTKEAEKLRTDNEVLNARVVELEGTTRNLEAQMQSTIDEHNAAMAIAATTHREELSAQFVKANNAVQMLFLKKDGTIAGLQKQLGEAKQTTHMADIHAKEHREKTENLLKKGKELYDNHKEMIKLFLNSDVASEQQAAAITAFDKDFGELSSSKAVDEV